MRSLVNYSLSLLIILLFLSCGKDADEIQVDEGPYDFYITGISKSLSYTFSPSNGRAVSSVPADVKMLTIKIANHVNEVVYEQYYYNWNDYYYYEDSLGNIDDENADYYYYENSIPDTLLIPQLPSGDYTIYAATGDLQHNYHYENSEDSTGLDLIIGSYMVMEGPIYVGKTAFTLQEEGQEVAVSMENISARITIELTSDNSGDDWIEVFISTRDNVYYAFSDESFHPNPYDYEDYIYLYGYYPKKHFYILPKTLTSVNVGFYLNTSNSYFSQEIDLDPDMPLSVGDAITFKLDKQALLEGMGSSVFNWEEITWNDLGSVAIP